ncbi:hypothetical protein [Duganella levis]|uniref:Uncharacterized protein n=1 Tax=Duganella levis TaxID=2692169 RepID=A0ABW9W381_9BURK|nr:hypothetical protein [Duganella levis]MYN28110.1 hypothetical protein [Duganella levis]
MVAHVHTLPGVLNTMIGLRPFGLVPTGPATYALLVSNGHYFSNEAILQLVVAH